MYLSLYKLKAARCKTPSGLLFSRCKIQGARIYGLAFCKATHLSSAKALSPLTMACILPRNKAKGSRSAIRDPWISTTFPPSNKYTSPVEGSWSKKKLTPPHLECPRCQAICDLDTETLLCLIIFNSSQITTPFMHIYTSGMPSLTRFSSLWWCVFLGSFCFNEFHRALSVFGIGHHLVVAIDGGLRKLFSKFGQSSNNLFPAQAVKLMDVVLFAPVDSQAAKGRSDLLGVDGGRELPCLFRTARQFVKPLQLTAKADPIFSFALFPQFFNQDRNMRKRFPIEKLGGMLCGRFFRIPCLPRTLGVGIDTFDIVSGKLSLSVGQPRWSAALFFFSSVISTSLA